MLNELSKYIDPVAIITLVVSFSYFFGWAYTIGFFSRLGIQYPSLNLPGSYYLSKSFWSWSILIVLLFFLVLASLLIKNYLEVFLNGYWSTFQFMIAAIAISISFYISTDIGEDSAEKLIEGDLPHLSTINFCLNESSPIFEEMGGKELILIIHQEGKYYIVNKQKPAPENPKVYIIPDDQIKFASIIRSPISYSDFSLKYFEKKYKKIFRKK